MCDLNLESRVAIYYAPELDDPLWKAGCTWLGRDPERATPMSQPVVHGIDALTADARGYGFHCTLKPPMRLATSYDEFRHDVGCMAKAIRPFDLPPFSVGDLSGFLALRVGQPNSSLQALSDLCVAWPDRHRRAPSDVELQKRRQTGLSADADILLLRWGYPGVFTRWRFHMTLTRRLSVEELSAWRSVAEQHFAASLAQHRQLKSICIFTQAALDAPFRLAERLPVG